MNQTLIDIQIVLLYNVKDKISKNKISKYQIIDDYTETIKIKNNNLMDIMIEIINKIEGRYLIIIDKVLELNKGDIYKIFNMTIGNINNTEKGIFLNIL